MRDLGRIRKFQGLDSRPIKKPGSMPSSVGLETPYVAFEAPGQDRPIHILHQPNELAVVRLYMSDRFGFSVLII